MSSAEREARLERGRQLLRREGLADAAAILALTRFRPGLTVEDYARVLGVSGDEIRAALHRRRNPAPTTTEAVRARRRAIQAAAADTKPPAAWVRCTEPGCEDVSYPDGRGLAAHIDSVHTPPVLCPNGCGQYVKRRGTGSHLRHCKGTNQ